MIQRIFEQQFIPAGLEEVWDFISSPENLQKITPAHMGFAITTPRLPARIYPGMIITYRVSPILRLRMNWVTEITQVKERHYFVDEQRIGPYAMWHHEHFIETEGNGVLLTDIVTYKLPLGILGVLAHTLFVRKQLQGIFSFRRTALEKIFPAP